MESRIRVLPVFPASTKISFPQKQYEDHIKWYPEDAELLNKEIYNFEWMKIIWGGSCKGGVTSKSTRSGHSVASAKGGPSSTKLNGDDDDFMPSKRAQVRSKGVASSKSSRSGKSVASLKDADDDYYSADDFMPIKRDLGYLMRNHVNEISDDDFM